MAGLRQRPQVPGGGLLPHSLLVAICFEAEDFSTSPHLAFWCKIPETSQAALCQAYLLHLLWTSMLYTQRPVLLLGCVSSLALGLPLA